MNGKREVVCGEGSRFMYLYGEEEDNQAKSKIINNVRYITAKVAGKPVSISKSSIRSDLLFDDADGIDSLPNQAIFDAIQLMGLFGYTAKEWKVTPLFSNMLVQPTEDEGEQSERPSELHLTPSPPHPKDSGGNHGGQSSNDSSLSWNEGGMTLQSVYDLCISLCTQGKKPAKAKPSIHKYPAFDELADDTFDYMDTENAQDVGRTRNVVYKEKESAKDAVSTKDVVSTDKEKEEVSIFRPDEGTDDQTKGRYDPQTRPTTTTPSIFGDDETIAQLKDVEETERPRATSTRSLLTLKPLPKIDPKDKGKKKIEEEDESDMNLEAQRRFLAEQRAIAIRNRPPTRTQLESDDDLFESLKRFDESFTTVGSTEDERKIKEMNEGAKDLKHKRLKKKVVKETSKKEDTAKVPAKVDVTEQGTKKRKGGHMKMIARKRKRPQPDVDSDDEHRKCLKIITFEEPTGTSEHSTIYGLVIPIIDRLRFIYLYELVMEQYSEITLEGIELGIDILELKDGTVIHMLVERRYPLSMDLLQMMLDLGLEVERESTAALDLIIFIKQ
ncbi:hypothetical protein Tco_0510809 [Tanacetum coccineum]